MGCQGAAVELLYINHWSSRDCARDQVGAPVVMCILAKPQSGMTMPSLLQHNPCHIEQSQPFNGERIHWEGWEMG